jgi:hypothetical protein
MYSLYYSCTAVLVLVPGTYSRTAVLYCSLVHVGALGVYPVQSSTYIVLVPGTYSRTAVCSLVVRGFMAVDKLRENNLEFSKTPVLSSCGLLLLSSDAPVLSSDGLLLSGCRIEPAHRPLPLARGAPRGRVTPGGRGVDVDGPLSPYDLRAGHLAQPCEWDSRPAASGTTAASQPNAAGSVHVLYY